MASRLRIVVLVLAVVLLPMQAVASVLMPLCSPQSAASHGHEGHAQHAGSGGAHEHSHHPGETHGNDMGACGVCHLASATAFDPVFGAAIEFAAERFAQRAPSRILSHIPALPQRPPLA